MVVACLALFVALGGVSYGVATGSIDGREIKNSSVASKDLKNNSAGTADIKNGSLLGGDFKSGQLPAGARGPEGPAGLAGRDGFGVVSYGFSPDEALGEPGSDSAQAPCSPGTVPVGGATQVYDLEGTPTDPDDDTLIEGDEARLSSETFTVDGQFTPNGWSGSAYNNSLDSDRVVTVIAFCVNADSIQGKGKRRGPGRAR